MQKTREGKGLHAAPVPGLKLEPSGVLINILPR